MTVSNTIDNLTDALLGLHAVLTIIGHNVVFVTGATLNTCVWASLLNKTPVVEVVA
jgi:hypothetical protein